MRLGLASIVEGNEVLVVNMLDASAADDLVEKLIECMGVSNLNAEMLLANWFSASILGEYAQRLGKSSKGSAATLADRIAREWAKPSFVPAVASKLASRRRARHRDRGQGGQGGQGGDLLGHQQRSHGRNRRRRRRGAAVPLLPITERRPTRRVSVRWEPTRRRSSSHRTQSPARRGCRTLSTS